MDIINPVQVSAKDMDSADLKREYGKDLTFWGGGVDTQRVLGSGTPASELRLAPPAGATPAEETDRDGVALRNTGFRRRYANPSDTPDGRRGRRGPG